MNTARCPRCGGTQNRLLAPGYYECTSEIIADVVPPGHHGNPAPVPVPGSCGHRFQAGGAPTQAIQCSCGMFAVGACRTCGQPLCGQHGTHAGNVFVCVRHLEEVAARSAIEAQRKNEAAKKRAAAATAQQQQVVQARRAVLPGFPQGATSASEVSRALERLVPSRARSYVVGRKKFGRTATVRGWGFPLSTTSNTSRSGTTFYRHRGLVISDDGRAFSLTEESQSPKWVPNDYLAGDAPRESLQVGADHVARILDAVLSWIGTSTAASKEATPQRAAHLNALVAEGRVSSEEAARMAPSGAVTDSAWARIRDIPVTAQEEEEQANPTEQETIWRAGGTSETPARTAHLERLVADGRLSPEQAQRLAPGGTVEDAAWRRIREL